METIWQDLRYGIRMLRKNPAFTAVAVLALALGIGANTAIFSIVNAVLLRPLPYKDPDRLVILSEYHRKDGEMSVSYLNFLDWRDQNQVFEQMAAFQGIGFNLTGVAEPERITGRNVSAAFFSTLGVKPILGRDFLPEEDRPGGSPVVVLSYSLWQRRFGADPALIGKSLTLNGSGFTVIGILPPTFQFYLSGDLFAPIGRWANSPGLADRGNHPAITVIGRLKPGVTLGQARMEMDTIARRLEQQYPQSNSGNGVRLVPLSERFVGNLKPTLLILLGAVGFVLLIACANVANLLLARAATRQKEIAIRMALGAGRFRVIRQMLTESVLLALLGSAVALLLALWSRDALAALLPEDIRRLKAIHIDGWVLGFTLSISLLTGVVFGLAPAFQASKPDLNESLKEGGRSSTPGFSRRSLRNALVISEVTLALVLLIGAGLLLRSLLRLQQVHPGFDPENVLTMEITLPQAKYPEGHQVVGFYQQVLRRIETLPGVHSASIVLCPPLVGSCWSSVFIVEGQPIPARAELPSSEFNVISPEYFRTMGIPLLEGRFFNERDTKGAPGVAIISESMARRFWPSEDPIGKRLKQGWPEDKNSWLSVVGVVGDVKRSGLDSPSSIEVYLPHQQWPMELGGRGSVVVRTSTTPLSLTEAIRKEVWAVDRGQPISNVRTMEQLLARSAAPRRFPMLVLGVFAAVALALAAIGIYGVMAYSVAQRTHEIGIRMALGAEPRDMLRLVVGQGLRLTLVGVAIGLFVALALTRLMSSLLFGISATDPAIFLTVPLLLTSVALLASYVPARKATKVDPMVALRYE